MRESWRRCCGIDVHKDTVVICVLGADGSATPPTRKTFSTFPGELIRLRMWLIRMRVTHIAMESTGVYWMPVWNTLDIPEFTLLLANPQQLKALRGRKSDQRDAKRIAEFLQDERLDGSFVPPAGIRRLRQLPRHRISLLEQRNEVHNAIRDLLGTSGMKRASVASDSMGVSGQGILRALAAGEESAARLSGKVRGKLGRKRAQMREALQVSVDAFQRQRLTLHLEHFDFLTSLIAKLELQIAEQIARYGQQLALLATIPGVDRIVAWNLLAEMGPGRSVFPDAAHCASWAGLAPGTEESAGKQRSGRTKKGNRYPRRILTQAAWANSDRKDGYLRAVFHRLKARRGWAKAIAGVAHKLIVVAYHILRNPEPYRELGGDYYDRLNPEKAERRLMARLERLGVQVQVVGRTAPAATTEAGAELEKRKRGRPRKLSGAGKVSASESLG